MRTDYKTNGRVRKNWYIWILTAAVVMVLALVPLAGTQAARALGEDAAVTGGAGESPQSSSFFVQAVGAITTGAPVIQNEGGGDGANNAAQVLGAIFTGSPVLDGQALEALAQR